MSNPSAFLAKVLRATRGTPQALRRQEQVQLELPSPDRFTRSIKKREITPPKKGSTFHPRHFSICQKRICRKRTKATLSNPLKCLFETHTKHRLESLFILYCTPQLNQTSHADNLIF